MRKRFTNKRVHTVGCKGDTAADRAELKAEEREEIMNFVEWLEETLIPDLHESGQSFTAQDFEKCVEIIKTHVLEI